MELCKFTDYAVKETERVKSELPPKSAEALRFAFITDLHYKNNDEMRVSVSNIIHAINELNKSERVDFVCLGGDNVGNYPPSREAHISMMEELASLFSHCDVPVMFVQGNHDENSIHGRLSQSSYVCRTGFEVSDGDQYDILFSLAEKSPSYHAGGSKALYGYFDAPSANVRVVFLNSSDVPYIVENGIMMYNQQWDFGYREEQLSWLCDVALRDAPENVILISHRSFCSSEGEEGESVYNEDALERITEAFICGGAARLVSSHEDFGYCLFADFKGEKHRVLRIGGHCHRDLWRKNGMGTLSVSTTLAGRKCSGLPKPEADGTAYEREPFSSKETSVDIFTLEPLENTLSAIRYGSGKNRFFEL